MNVKNKFQFSKILVILTALIFLFCIFKSISVDLSTAIDTTVYVTLVTVSGGIFGMTLKWYLMKSQLENSYKIQNGMYKDVMNYRLEYNTKMMELKNKYKITDDDISIIESESPMDDMSEEMLNKVTNNINTYTDDALQSPEIQTY